MTRIAIIGAGVAGLVLAQCLKRRQIPAIVFEKAKQFPAQQNFGITLFPQSYNPLLQALSIDRIALLDAAGIGETGSDKQPSDHEAPLRVNRPALLKYLAKDIDIRWNQQLKDLATDEGKHKLIFSESNHADNECDVVIIAEGVHSATRKALKLDSNIFELEVLPFIVYNGKRRFPVNQAPTGLAACLKQVEGLNYKKGDTLLQITSGYFDQEAREMAINYTLSRPAKSPSDEELLERSNSDAELLAKKFLEEAASIDDLPEPFKTVFDPQLMKDDRLLHWLMRSALIDAGTLERLNNSGIGLIGDAAHPVPILGGHGANNAILDAIKLADSIAETGSINIWRRHQSWKRVKDQAEQDLRQMHQSERSVI